MSRRRRGWVRRAGRAVLVLGLGATLVGCGSLEVFDYPLGHPGPANQGPPAIHFEGQPVDASYRELAMVEVTAAGTQADPERVIQALAEGSARWGATDVFRVRVDCRFDQCHGVGIAVLRSH